MKIRFGIAAALLATAVLVAAPPSAVADYRQGAVAIRSGDYARGFELLHEAAEQGDARAQAAVANMYLKGYGIERDSGLAAKWYRAAADQGRASAQYNLGVMYRDGIGVDRDDHEATRLFELAARQGFKAAQINLGLRYARGRTVERDLVRGYAWLHRAAMHGDIGAMRRRDAVAAEMTEEEIDEARSLAVKLRPD